MENSIKTVCRKSKRRFAASLSCSYQRNMAVKKKLRKYHWEKEVKQDEKCLIMAGPSIHVTVYVILLEKALKHMKTRVKTIYFRMF